MCQEFEGVKKWHNCYGRQATRVNTNWWNQETPTSLQEIASCYLALYFDSKCIEMLCIAFFWTVKVYVSFVWWNANDGQWTPALFFLFFLIQHWWRVLVQLRHWYLLISDMYFLKPSPFFVISDVCIDSRHLYVLLVTCELYSCHLYVFLVTREFYDSHLCELLVTGVRKSLMWFTLVT